MATAWISMTAIANSRTDKVQCSLLTPLFYGQSHLQGFELLIVCGRCTPAYVFEIVLKAGFNIRLQLLGLWFCHWRELGPSKRVSQPHGIVYPLKGRKAACVRIAHDLVTKISKKARRGDRWTVGREHRLD